MRRPARLLAAVTAGALLAGAPAVPAGADIVDDGEPGLLSIEAHPAFLDVELDPGDSAAWLLTARLDAPSDGELLLRIRRSGELTADPGGLVAGIRECSVPWQPLPAPATGLGCPGETAVVLGPMPLAQIGVDDVWDLGGIPDGGSRRFLVTIALPEAAPAELQGASGEFELEFAASGDVEEVGTAPGPRPDPLALTGVAVAAPLALAGGLALVGAVLRSASRRREESP